MNSDQKSISSTTKIVSSHWQTVTQDKEIFHWISGFFNRRNKSCHGSRPDKTESSLAWKLGYWYEPIAELPPVKSSTVKLSFRYRRKTCIKGPKGPKRPNKINWDSYLLIYHVLNCTIQMLPIIKDVSTPGAQHQTSKCADCRKPLIIIIINAWHFITVIFISFQLESTSRGSINKDKYRHWASSIVVLYNLGTRNRETFDSILSWYPVIVSNALNVGPRWHNLPVQTEHKHNVGPLLLLWNYMNVVSPGPILFLQ